MPCHLDKTTQEDHTVLTLLEEACLVAYRLGIPVAYLVEDPAYQVGNQVEVEHMP